MNSKAQAFASFKLLIGAVIGLMTLVMIISTINHFEKIRLDVSYDLLIQGFQVALESVDESGTSIDSEPKIVERKELIFENFVLSKTALKKITGLLEECIEFQAVKRNSIVRVDDVVEIKERTKVDVYYKCIAQYEGCNVYCIASFGKKIEE